MFVNPRVTNFQKNLLLLSSAPILKWSLQVFRKFLSLKKHDINKQKAMILMFTAVRTPNPIYLKLNFILQLSVRVFTRKINAKIMKNVCGMDLQPTEQHETWN
jgi:hypothetical protein